MDEKHNQASAAICVHLCVCEPVNMYVVVQCASQRVCAPSLMWLVMWRSAGDGPVIEPAG